MMFWNFFATTLRVSEIEHYFEHSIYLLLTFSLLFATFTFTNLPRLINL